MCSSSLLLLTGVLDELTDELLSDSAKEHSPMASARSNFNRKKRSLLISYLTKTAVTQANKLIGMILAHSLNLLKPSQKKTQYEFDAQGYTYNKDILTGRPHHLPRESHSRGHERNHYARKKKPLVSPKRKTLRNISCSEMK